MGSFGKSTSLLIILILVVTGFIVVPKADAQLPAPSPPIAKGITVPSVPEFTVIFDDDAIVVTVKNQSYTSVELSSNFILPNNATTYLCFDVQSKLHDSTDWRQWYNASSPYGFPKQNSTSEYTVISSASFSNCPDYADVSNNTQVDVQVQAMNGWVGIEWARWWVFYGVTSDWSNKQTITMPPATSPTPTSTVPEFSSLTIQLTLITMIAVTGLLIYFKKRKR